MGKKVESGKETGGWERKCRVGKKGKRGKEESREWKKVENVIESGE